MTAGRTNHRAFAAAPREHVRLVHVGCERQHCAICDGGLFVCTVCGQAEGTLAPVCPGPQANPPPPAPARFITRSDSQSAQLAAAFNRHYQRIASPCAAECCEQGCACPGDCLGALR